MQGPRSSLSAPIPTTCFVDVILVPLPVWIAVALLLAVIFLSSHGRRSTYKPSVAHPRTQRFKRWLHSAVSTVYYILIACNILMQTLEIVRLSLIHFGLGLLPFAYVGLIMGAVLHWSRGIQGRVQAWQGINGVLWLGGAVMSVVKVVGLVEEGVNGRKGSNYPVSDQVIDVAVMAGVYAVIGTLEAVFGAWGVKRGQKYEDSRKASSLRQDVLEHH